MNQNDILKNLNNRTANGVAHYWQTRGAQRKKQVSEGVSMMSGVTKFWIIAALLVLAGLEMGAAQDLPKNFPANVIPIPEDAVRIRDLPGFDYLVGVGFISERGPKAMIKYYRDNLGKTIPVGLKEALGKKDTQYYWFWGEFDNSNAFFHLTIDMQDNDVTYVQIRVLFRQKNESVSHWKLNKETYIKTNVLYYVE
jgi:hypothetical protein